MIHLAPYIALLSIFLIFLSIRVIRIRRSQNIGVGVGGSPELALANGVFENFVEYTPFAFALGLAVVMLDMPAWVVHMCLGPFTLGRFLHYYGYSKFAGLSAGRFYGMILTFLGIAFGAFALLIHSLGSILH